jgi:hypothetical protein
MQKNDMITTIPIRDRNGKVIGEKQVARYAGLLAKAHEEGLKAISTKLVQAPSPENGNLAIVRATVQTHKGVFEALGDASPENVSSFVSPHIVRMAATRSKARALRDALNIGCVALEELVADATEEGIVEEEQSGGNGRTRHDPPEALMTEPQRRYLFRLLAQRGFEGEKAREAILRMFGVEQLNAVTKREASRMIDLVQKDQAPNIAEA